MRFGSRWARNCTSEIAPSGKRKSTRHKISCFFGCWDTIPIPVNITARDGCALLRSAERAFWKKAKPASARCRTTGLGCVQQALAKQGALYIQRHCLQESFGVPEWYHEALLAEAIASIWIVNSARSCYTGLIKNFSGGSCRDRKASSNRR